MVLRSISKPNYGLKMGESRRDGSDGGIKFSVQASHRLSPLCVRSGLPLAAGAGFDKR